MAQAVSKKKVMNATFRAYPLTATTDLPVPLRRFVLAWAVMVGGLVGFW